MWTDLSTNINGAFDFGEFCNKYNYESMLHKKSVSQNHMNFAKVQDESFYIYRTIRKKH